VWIADADKIRCGCVTEIGKSSPRLDRPGLQSTDAMSIIKRSNRYAPDAPFIFHHFDFQKQQVT
jgi:hypothetical protein